MRSTYGVLLRIARGQRGSTPSPLQRGHFFFPPNGLPLGTSPVPPHRLQGFLDMGVSPYGNGPIFGADHRRFRELTSRQLPCGPATRVLARAAHGMRLDQATSVNRLNWTPIRLSDDTG